MRVLIQGKGIAARCCERLLVRAGEIQVAIKPNSRVPVPALMLAEPALALIRDVFGNQDLWRAAPKIRNRVVAWHRDAGPETVPHSAVVISERELLEELAPASGLDETADADLTIHSALPLPACVADHAFGTRKSHSIPVVLRNGAASQTCWIESVAQGWLFLIPEGAESAWLLSVGAAPDVLLAQSRVVAKQIDSVGLPSAAFSAYPRVASPLCGPGWIACGTAAMGFDPICGDGTAHAVREGVLASAVAQAVSRGADAEELCCHYDARLIAGLERHLKLCCDFYQSGFGGPWWEQETELAEQGLAWCSARLAEHGPFRYRLDDFELKRLVR